MSAATILLVDDDDVLSQVLRRVLSREGYDVIEAGSVAQALEVVRDHKPQLGLLDLSLPDGDGMELAKKLRAQGVDCPLILVTAYPLRLRDHPELSSAFTRVLTKPLNLQDLRQAIDAALSGTAAAPPAPAEEGDWGRAPRIPPPTPEPSPAPAPTAGGSRWPWLAGSAVAAVLAAIGVALPALGVPGIPNPFRSAPPPAPAPEPSTLGARRVPGRPNVLLVTTATVERLNITTAAVEKATRPLPLQLSGTLNLDPNFLSRVHPLFPGEVVWLAGVKEPGSISTKERPLGFGDPVTKDDLLAVVWSKDLGEKKSELIDALSQLWVDEETLTKLEELYRDLATSEANVRLAHKAVASDRNAVAKAERTLRVWRLSEEALQAVKDEARRIYDNKGVRDLQKEQDWARVEVRAKFSGTVVEKNVAAGDIVDVTTDLYKIADLGHLTAWVHVYAEYLPKLQDLPRPIPWKVEAGGHALDSPGAEEIGPIIDPNQHTALVIGRVDNPGGKLRVGQFVTATIDLKPPEGLTAVPVAAVVEDGIDSVVFVRDERQPDPAAIAFSLRRVAVVQRLPDVLIVRAAGLTDEEKKKGLQELHAGEQVATKCVVELKAELESQQEPGKAE